MQFSKIRFLSKNDLKKALTMHQTIEAMQDAFIQLSEGKVTVPLRTPLNLPEKNGTALFMPVYSPSAGKFGLKIVSIHTNNSQKNLPAIHALVVILNAENGIPLAVMDGEYLTALRTGAASGLAARLLSRKNSETVALFGAGVQGRTQLEAVCTVRTIKNALIFDPDQKKCDDFAEEMSATLNISIHPGQTLESLAEADIICTATSSQTPVFAGDQLKPGVHVNGIGSYRPDMAEIPPEIIIGSKLVVDSRESCLAEAGDIIQAMKHSKQDLIHAEIGEVAAGKAAGRTSDKEITVFKSVGNAVQDLITAELAIKNAEKMNLGIEVEI
jgi:ornithine cyclodeaminase/alanine dehydrogenase-like protein (mu-crystallin family)